MKTESYFLGSNNARRTILHRITSLDIAEAHYKITISDSMGKSARQRGLQHQWNTDVANSGYGSYDTKEDVHRAAKYRWAVPILIRDDDDFAEIWSELKSRFLEDKVRMSWIVDNFVSTEGKDFAIHEYLTDFERYYRGNGVDLVIPEDGLLQLEDREA